VLTVPTILLVRGIGRTSFSVENLRGNRHAHPLPFALPLSIPRGAGAMRAIVNGLKFQTETGPTASHRGAGDRRGAGAQPWWAADARRDQPVAGAGAGSGRDRRRPAPSLFGAFRTQAA
jgi:hypothetical protein